MKVVVTSVHYADFLAVTLPAWREIVPAGCLMVATSPDDVDTHAVAAACDVPIIATEAWSQRDPSCHVGDGVHFNLALGLDVALIGLLEGRVAKPARGEVCGHVSADCYPVGHWPADDRFTDDTIYGFWRYDCPTTEAFDRFQRDRRIERFPRLKNAHGWPIGYCQLFRYREGLRFGSFPTAGKFDIRFRERFPNKVMLGDVSLLHLGPSSVRSNWAGRTIPHWGAA